MLSGPKPKVSENAFEDLLGNHKFTSNKKDEPRTMKDMRREIDAKDMDPETLKVLYVCLVLVERVICSYVANLKVLPL